MLPIFMMVRMTIMGLRKGMVMFQICCHFVAPSMSAAS